MGGEQTMLGAEARLEICALHPRHCTLALRVVDQNEQVIVSSQGDLVAGCFKGLSALYYSKTCTLSPQSAVGLLAGNDESPMHMCGTILPLVVLNELCAKALSMESIKTFLLVCSCFYDLEIIVQNWKLGAASLTGTTPRKSVEMPASAIFEMLILSEVFGTVAVFAQCRSKLLNMLTPSGGPLRPLPASVTRCLPPKSISGIEERLVTHLLRFSSPVEDIPSTQVSPATTVASEQSARSPDPIPMASTGPYTPAEAPPRAMSVDPCSEAVEPLQAHSADEDDAHTLDTWATDDESDNAHHDPQEEHTAHSVASSMTSRESVGRSSRIVPLMEHNEPANYRPAPAAEVVTASVGFGQSRRAPLLYASLESLPRRSPPRRARSPPLPRTSSVVAAAPSSGRRSRHTSPAPSPTTATETPRRSLSIEDLQLSREVALLRLREARIQKELEDSRAQAEAALRENKLASLRLKTDILRLGSSRSSTPRRSARPPEGRRNLIYLAEEEAQQVETARLMALKRIADQRRKEQQLARKAELTAEQEAQRRFHRRDERIAQFVQRQHRDTSLAKSHPPPPPPPPAPASHALTAPATPNARLVADSVPSPAGLGASPGPRSRPRPSPEVVMQHRYMRSPPLVPPPPPPVDEGAMDHYEGGGHPVYSREALAAVGLGLSPTHAAPSRSSSGRRGGEGGSGALTLKPFASKAAEVAVRYTLMVLRGWGLGEVLGGTNPYVVASWAAGSASKATAQTPACANTTQPEFNASLVLEELWPRRLPLTDEVADKVLVLRVFSRNASLSDELLGCAEVPVESLLGSAGDYSAGGLEQSGSLQVVYLTDRRNRTAGCLELSVARQVLP